MLNRLVKYYSLIIIQFFITAQSFCQNDILDTNKPGLKWYQINTENFRIVFEGGNLSEAQRIANTMETLYKPVSMSLGVTPKKISIILQNYQAISNGFVTQTPRKSEFYTMPAQDYNFLGLLDWMDLLSVHEFRHVVQFDKSLTKFNKGIFYLLGYNAASSMAHIAVPEWFWEGDAVVIETALTRGGRGRIPNFGIQMRANTLERGIFDYHRQYLRSFKYQIQDHYTFGYYMTSFLRRSYGEDFLAQATGETWGWPFLPFRFSNRIKKYSGKNLIRNYNSMMRELDSLWRGQIDSREFTRFRKINFRYTGAYSDYLYPQYLNDGSVVALKSGIGDIPTFVVFDETGKDRKIHIPGIINNTGMLSVSNDVIVWNEIEFDPRWGNHTFSVIKIYDLKTQELKRVTRRSRYSSAALSPGGNIIATVETTNDSKHKIAILDTQSGILIEELPNPENHFFLNPRWSSDGSSIVAVKQTGSGKILWRYDLEKSIAEDIWDFGHENIGYPLMFDHYIFYNSPYDGIDNVYVMDLNTNKRYRVSSGKYGTYNAVVSREGTKILFNNFTEDGHDIAEIAFDTASWVPLDQIFPQPEDYYKPILAHERPTNVLDSIEEETYPVTRYRRGSKILNPYSWGPIVRTTDLDLFIGVSSRDIMNTSILDLGYQLNSSESTGQWVGNFSYQGLYPVLNFQGYIGDRALNERFPVVDDNGQIVDDTLSRVTWKERGLLTGIELPLNLTRSRYLERFNLGFNYNYNFVKDYMSYESIRWPDMQDNGSLLSNVYYLSYRRMMRSSKRDLYGRFGQFLYLQYEHTPWKASDFNGELFAAQLRLFFPGLFKHHAFHYRIGYLKQLFEDRNDLYLFKNPIFWTRGYAYRTYHNYLNNSVNYTLPLWYPDLNFGSLLNIQRIYANIFFDIGLRNIDSIQKIDQAERFRAVGAEVSFDFNLMRYLALFNMGFRYTYAMDDPAQPHQWQLLIGQFGF